MRKQPGRENMVVRGREDGDAGWDGGRMDVVVPATIIKRISLLGHGEEEQKKGTDGTHQRLRLKVV